MDTRCVSCTAENPAIPADLADGLGTGRLTHLALESVQGLEVPWTEFRLGPGYPGHSFRVLLTLLTYAYGRGVLASDEVLDRVGRMPIFATSAPPSILTPRPCGPSVVGKGLGCRPRSRNWFDRL